MLTLIKADLNPEMSVKNFTDLLLIKYNYLESDFAQVYIVLLLFFTMPITSASAERFFSKLKMIKNYLRNQIGQERLKYLSLISIESKAANKLDLKDLIDEFAMCKARKKSF